MTKLIPMLNDKVFKRIWGDEKRIERLEYLISVILHMPKDKLKGKVEIIESEKRKNNLKEKDQRVDIVAKVNIDDRQKINIELNVLNGKSKGLIDRNISYVAFLYAGGIKVKENYEEIESVKQINFNTFYVSKNKKVIDEYYIQNEEGEKLTKKLQIIHVNIEKGKNICYTEEDKYKRELIKIGKLLSIDNEEELDKCLGEMDMEEEMKREIKEDMDDLSSDEEIVAFFNSEKDRIMLQNTYIKEATREGFNNGFNNGFKDGLKDGKKQEKIEIAKNMLDKKIDVNTISEVTGLSLDEINNLG